MYTFLNSPLGLWLLSTVFISAGSWIYTTWIDERRAQEGKRERIERLDTEIQGRLDEAQLSQLLVLTQGSDAARDEFVASLPRKIFLPPDASIQIYPEYANRNLGSLLVELRALLDERDWWGAEADCVRQAVMLERIERVRWLSRRLRPEDLDEFRQAVGRIGDHRWSVIARLERLESRMDGPTSNEINVKERRPEPYCMRLTRTPAHDLVDNLIGSEGGRTQ
ncbi:MAG TPA: hypothetical protein VGW40_13280 [Allosphingosinicella sp.]|nr:hypothetical protein [Allosphingosinicella sp.]